MAMNVVNDLVAVLGNGLPPVAPRYPGNKIVCDLLQDLRTVGPGSTILPTSRLTAWEFTNQLIQKMIKFAI